MVNNDDIINFTLTYMGPDSEIEAGDESEFTPILPDTHYELQLPEQKALSKDITQKIFSHLDFDDLAAVSQVNKAWNDCVNDYKIDVIISEISSVTKKLTTPLPKGQQKYIGYLINLHLNNLCHLGGLDSIRLFIFRFRSGLVNKLTTLDSDLTDNLTLDEKNSPSEGNLTFQRQMHSLIYESFNDIGKLVELYKRIDNNPIKEMKVNTFEANLQELKLLNDIDKAFQYFQKFQAINYPRITLGLEFKCERDKEDYKMFFEPSHKYVDLFKSYLEMGRVNKAKEFLQALPDFYNHLKFRNISDAFQLLKSLPIKDASEWDLHRAKEALKRIPKEYSKRHEVLLTMIKIQIQNKRIDYGFSLIKNEINNDRLNEIKEITTKE
ncbi:MAG: F-box protein, partial [Chlamydiota bacterium]